MLKYHKKVLCKALSMLLAAAMLLTAPIGTMQAYAQEDEQPRAELFRSPEIFVIKTADDLRDVLNNLVDGDVIRLSNNIDYTTNDFAVGISTKVTFDLGNYTLNITSSQNNGTGLVVGSGGEVSLQGFTGELNVSGGSYGLQVLSGAEFAEAMVTNATARNAGGAGISAVGNANAVALGNISSYGAGAHSSGIGSTVHVHGEISARTFGTYSVAGGKITAKKGVTQIGEDGTGAYISGLEAGSIMIGGDIKAKDYIRFDDTFVAKGDGVADPTEPGYTKYTNGAGVVWVKEVIVPDDSVCAISGTQYATLDEALAAVKTKETIKLLKDINHDKGIVIDGKTFTFDVDSFTLNVTNTLTGKTHGVGLEVINGGNVNLVGTGEFNVTTINGAASSDGVVVRENSSAMVTNVKTISGSGNGVYADGNGAIIKVLGDIEAKGSNSCVARTFGTGSITIEGTVVKGLYYVRIHNDLSEIEGVLDSEKPGYLKYSSKIYQGIVWVKDLGYDKTPPTWPGDSTITGFLTATTLTLTWPKAEDNVRVDKYLIYTVVYTGEEGDSGVATLITEIRHDNSNEVNPEFELINLDPETKHRIRITAVDTSGNINEWSLEREFVTKKAFTIAFDSQGGSPADNQIITEGETATNPITTRAGFNFGGSYKVIVANTKDGFTRVVESTICTFTVNTSGGGNNDYTPIDKDRDKRDKTKKPVEIINGIIILDIDQDIIDKNTLVPYFLNNGYESIVKFSAIFGDKMHLIGDKKTDYLLKDNKKHFTDISNHWAKDDINFVTARELFVGSGDNLFSPDSLITRGMVVTILGRLWDADVSRFGTSRFKDVEVGRNYAPYIEWAAKSEIVKGIGNNSFAPDRAITREELAVIIDKFVDFTDLILTEVDKNTLTFKDYLLISQWAIDSVETIQKTEIILGKPGNLFVPKGISTRGEFSAVLKRLTKNIVK